MSVMWDDFRIENEIEREWKAHGETYQYMWVRTLCRSICHDTEARLTMPKQVRLVLLACVREVIDAEGMTPALAAAREWLKEAEVE
jgi:hypothetical protein